jgi:hypothetical protein
MHAREAAAGQRTRNMMICEGKKAQAEQPNIIRSLLRKRPQNYPVRKFFSVLFLLNVN